MPTKRRFALSTLLASAILTLGAIPAAAGHALQRVHHYVALGDSYASGPLIPVQQTNPVGCLRSDHNYPSLLAGALNPDSFTDVTCGGATTDDMTQPQNLMVGQNAPQFNALTPDTDLVTLTIGGNDIGFIDILTTCGALSVTDPTGAPCQAQEGNTFNDRITAAAPKVAAVLDGIHQRAPHATVAMVSYLRILPPSQGCFPLVPVAAGDVPFLDGVQRSLNSMLATQAGAAHALFVDSYAGSSGRDVCQPPDVRWVEGVVPTSPAAPFHPNLAGMQAVAGFAQRNLTSTSVNTASLN